MARNLSVQELHNFIVRDFADAWDSLAANPAAEGRGNFMFARQVMTLLEWGARLCASDATGSVLREWSQALMQREPRYFTPLPGMCADFDEFDLPSSPVTVPQGQLLWALFDLVRNGHAHQYQQIVLELTDGKEFMITHSGATLSLDFLRSQGRAQSDHLAYRRGRDQHLYLLVRPDWLLFDLKDSIDAAHLLSRGLTFEYLRRPRGPKTKPKPKIPGPYYQFDSGALETALQNGHHSIMAVGPP